MSIFTYYYTYNTKKQAFSAMPIRLRTSISNSNIVVFFTKDNKNTYPKREHSSQCPELSFKRNEGIVSRPLK